MRVVVDGTGRDWVKGFKLSAVRGIRSEDLMYVKVKLIHCIVPLKFALRVELRCPWWLSW